MDAAELDDCGCCAHGSAPAAAGNAPGLPALSYRVDEQPGFYRRMLESLALVRFDGDDGDPAAPRPLARLISRSPADPGIALLDAAACAADVLSFYQERIANEGFIGTATERRSVLELARAIGYELKPGVAAAVHLAFTVEDAPGSPGLCALARGTPVQSVPAQGKLPQVFETSAAIVARAEWNALRPRSTRPADMALLDLPAANPAAAAAGLMRKALVLVGPQGSFAAAGAKVVRDLQSQDMLRLAPELGGEGMVDAVEVSRVYVAGSVPPVAGGDLVLFAASNGSKRSTLVLRAVEVVAEPALQRVRIDLEALPVAAAAPAPPAGPPVLPYAVRPLKDFAHASIAGVPFTRLALTKVITLRTWRERELQAMIGIQRWNPASVVKAVTQPAGGDPVAPQAGAFVFNAKLGFFGHNAPKWAVLPAASGNVHGDAYPKGWDKDDLDGAAPAGKLAAPRTVWEDSQGRARAAGEAHVYLERAVPGVVRGGWTVFDAPDQEARPYGVFDAREGSRADYGISGRGLALTLAGGDGAVLAEGAPPPFRFRASTAHVASRRLVLAELPIAAPVAAGDTAIELDRMVLGLAPGQPVALTGERDDAPGVDAAEIALLSDIVHAGGRSTLILRKGLQFSYRRSSLAINANTVHATHGESVAEVLGNGNAALPHQRFTLKKPPTTFVAAPTPRGVDTTLEVRVNGVLWDEVDGLYGAAPDQQVYETRIDDGGRTQLVFGDGVQGARLPTGALNVAARYRSGIGPDGEVAAGALSMPRALPLGLRGVSNPVPASGAEGPERLADARRNAPLTLLTFERVVSQRDYQDFARAYPGIGKARADVLWLDGARLVFLSVAGATGAAPGEDVMANLPKSIAAASDPAQRFRAAPFVQRYFSCAAALAVDPRYRFADVQAAVAALLLHAFGFGARELGHSVTAAEVTALVHTVAGVLAVDLLELRAYSDDAAAGPAVADAVPAFGARRLPGAREVTPAELLLINPAALTLTEMPA